MLSSLFFLNDHGEVMMELQLNDKLPRSVLEGYWSTFIAPRLSSCEAPAALVEYGGHSFSYIHNTNVSLLGSCAGEEAALSTLGQLKMVLQVLSSYLKEVTENTIRENFSLVYQLLLEMFDYGYPLTTELFALEELVPKPTLENRVMSMLDTSLLGKTLPGAGRSGITVPPTGYYSGGGLPWRSSDVKHSNNELLLDVVEVLDCIVDAEGRYIKNSVRGSIEALSRLSGMPEVFMGLEGVGLFDHVGFHRCVTFDTFESHRTISFIPPDGKFTLMQYTCKPSVALPLPPFYVTPQLTFNATGGRFHCMAGLRRDGSGPGSLKASEVHRLVVRLLLPPRTASMTVSNCTCGSTAFDRAKGILTWSVGNLTNATTPSLGGEFFLDRDTSAAGSSGSNSGGSAVALISFQLPNQIMSYLKVELRHVRHEVGNSYKGVKYLTQSGNYVVRSS